MQINIQEAEGFARGRPPRGGLCPRPAVSGRVLAAPRQGSAWRKELILWWRFHLGRAWPGQAEGMAFAVLPGWQGSATQHQQGAMQLGFMSAVKTRSSWCLGWDVHGLPQ